MPRRILLLYISEVSGHHSATLALEKALLELDSSAVVKNINAFNFTNPFAERIINKAYMGVIKKTPSIWGYLYDNPKFIKTTEGIKNAIHRFNHRKLKILFNEFEPAIIVCTQAYPFGIIADYKRTFNVNIPLIGVLTDYAPHAYWIYKEANYYIVASEEARERFINEGAPADNIKLFGIPINTKFIKHHDRQKLIQKFGINPDLPVILIMGGGQGLGPIKKIVNELNSMPNDFQIIIVAGINKSLAKWLNKRQSKMSKKMFVLEYVDNVDEIMEISSMVITKPGGLTTAEALAKGLPMIIIHPIPGQEMNNTNYLLKKGAAIKVEDAKELKVVLHDLLENKHKLFKMGMVAKEISRPDASINIANLLLSING